MRFQTPGGVIGHGSAHGSREEQLQRVFTTLRHQWSQSTHTSVELYTRTEDCAHTNPEEDERFDGVDDLIDEWMERNCAGLKISDNWMLHFRNRHRVALVVPLVGEYERAMRDWEDNHSGEVCLASPMGSMCGGCNEDYDADFGLEPGGCDMPEQAREAWDEFWYRVSAD